MKKHQNKPQSDHLTSVKVSKKTGGLFILGSVVVGVLVSVMLFQLIESARKPYVPAYVKTPVAGQVLSTNLYEIEVSKVALTSAPDMAFKIPDGYQNVILTIAMTNKSAKPLDFFPVQQTFLRDNAGDTYVMVPSLEVTKPYPAGTIDPGATVSGQVAYRIPQNLAVAQNIKIYLDPRWGEMQPVAFALGI